MSAIAFGDDSLARWNGTDSFTPEPQVGDGPLIKLPSRQNWWSKTDPAAAVLSTPSKISDLLLSGTTDARGCPVYNRPAHVVEHPAILDDHLRHDPGLPEN